MTDWERYKEEVRGRTDIAQVIGRFVNLKRQGSQMVGRCPFHDDHSPSLHVTPHPGFYKCFVCGAGGDVFRFLIEHEKVSFREALEQLGREAGIEPPTGPALSSPQEEEGRRSRAALQWAQGWYHQRMRETPAVLEYARKRGFTQEELSDFHIGFAPDEPGVFLRAAVEAGHAETVLESAGLVARNDHGGWRERFRCRLVIPLHDQGKRPVGFAGRILRKDERSAKYLNSPETRHYHKGRYLFGLSHSRTECAKSQEAVLVEGYMDWFALWRHGFRNVVAVSGTAFTKEQAALLRRFCRKATCLFDGDKAGQAATLRSLPVLLVEGFEVRFCSLAPTGFKDPDELLKAKGADALRGCLEGAPHWEAWMVDDFAKQRASRSPEDQREFVDRLHRLIETIPDDLVRRNTWGKLEPRLEMADLRPEDMRLRRAPPRPATSAAPTRSAWKGRERAQAEFLHVLLTHPSLALDISHEIHPSQLQGETCQEVLDAVLAQAETGNPDAASVMEYLGPEALSFAQELFRFFPLKDELTARKYVAQSLSLFRAENVRKERARMLLSARASAEGGEVLGDFSALLAREQHLRETESQR
jgi:DNA primase